MQRHMMPSAGEIDLLWTDRPSGVLSTEQSKHPQLGRSTPRLLLLLAAACCCCNAARSFCSLSPVTRMN